MIWDHRSVLRAAQFNYERRTYEMPAMGMPVLVGAMGDAEGIADIAAGIISTQQRLRSASGESQEEDAGAKGSRCKERSLREPSQRIPEKVKKTERRKRNNESDKGTDARRRTRRGQTKHKA